ncbi:MAG: hypothetical protein IJS58_03275 [Bacilli bacterium]|nr:hypothetical protein [Bacilli bacterium]
MKKVLFLIITSLLILAPIGSNIDSCFNKIIITYAAKSTNKKSSSTKKKKSSTKKKTTGNNKSYNNSAKKNTTSKKSTSTYNSNSISNNSSSGAKNLVVSDDTICYISEYGDCYHKSSKCASCKKPIETTVGNAKKYKSKCSKCW